VPVLDTFQSLSPCGILSCMGLGPPKDISNYPKYQETSQQISDPDSITPPYYNGDDVMQIIERYDLSFCLGNVIKYTLRSKNKNGIEDLKKALWYLKREISHNG
jgi:hypothetical protein